MHPTNKIFGYKWTRRSKQFTLQHDTETRFSHWWRHNFRMQHGMSPMLKSRSRSRRAADLLQLMDLLTYIKLYTKEFRFSSAGLHFDRWSATIRTRSLCCPTLITGLHLLSHHLLPNYSGAKRNWAMGMGEVGGLVVSETLLAPLQCT